MIDFIEYEDKSGEEYVKPERHFENEVHDIRIYCEHPGCKTYIKGKEGYNGGFMAETGQRADLRNDVWFCTEHQTLYDHLKKAVPVFKEIFKEKEMEKFPHTVKEIVKNSEAVLTHVCEGKVYYEIHVLSTSEKSSATYQLEINSNDPEWKATYIYPRFKAITLMRWIRKGMKNEKLIQIK